MKHQAAVYTADDSSSASRDSRGGLALFGWRSVDAPISPTWTYLSPAWGIYCWCFTVAATAKNTHCSNPVPFA
ncbi:hypothetical protein PC128_g27232 [Phytophthora cactorum]|nr:hypothetical protein PC128_g27232 [Phytophthora cactorum]